MIDHQQNGWLLCFSDVTKFYGTGFSLSHSHTHHQQFFSYSNIVFRIDHTACNFALKLILQLQKLKKSLSFWFISRQKSELYKLSIDRSILENGEKLLFQSKTPCYIYKQYSKYAVCFRSKLLSNGDHKPF